MKHTDKVNSYHVITMKHTDKVNSYYNEAYRQGKQLSCYYQCQYGSSGILPDPDSFQKPLKKTFTDSKPPKILDPDPSRELFFCKNLVNLKRNVNKS